MAQIVTITNPLTGQPAQVDQLEHTAQEIDDAIARALPGGAIDLALSNKAEKTKISTSLSSAGWYRAAFMSGSAGGEATSYIVSISENYANYTPHSTVFMLSIGAVGAATTRASLTRIGNPTEIGGGYSVDKVRFVAGANVIGGYLDIHYNRSGPSNVGVSIVPLDYLYFLNMLDFASVPDTVSEYAVYGYADEWNNPPMALGVEYRTTERCEGRPVYAKRIHCESMPSGAGYIDIQSSDTEVPNALISTAIAIRCYGRASVKATIPFYSSSSDFMQVGSVGNNKIRIYTAKAYGGTADITVHYVKSTD